MTTHRPAAAGLWAACVVLTAACSLGSGPSASRVPALPDLGKLSPSVQQQLRDEHARLATLVSRGAGGAELGAAYGELGRLLMAAQFTDAPGPFLQRAETLAPEEHRWPYYRAQFHRQRGEPQRAAPHFERALQLRPDDVASYVWLGEIALQLGRPDEAATRFTAALDRQPTSVSARYGLGRAALARGDHRGAITQLEAVLTRDATATAAHYPLSQAYAAIGDTARAEQHLAKRTNREILPADPLMVELETLLESPQSYETRGIRALEAGDGGAAATAFRRGLELAPDMAALHHRLGAALHLQGDRAAARQEWEAAVRLSADQFLAHYSLGLLDQEDGRHDDAIAHFGSALAIRSTYAAARLRRASSLRRRARAADALAEYRRVLDDDATHVEAHVGVAMTLVQLQKSREARAHLEEALRAAPDAAALSHALARVLAAAPDARARDGIRARLIVEQLVQQGRSLDLGETLAMALAELGEFTRAVAVQRDLLTAARRAGLTAVTIRLSENLAGYEARRPCRVPWTEQEWP